MTVRDAMQSNVHVVESKLKLSDLDDAFFRHQVSGFPVVDGDKLVGVVSRSDVVRKFAIETSTLGQLSDYYRDPADAGSDADRQTFEAVASDVGVRIASMSVRDVMAQSLTTVTADQPLADAARVLSEQRIHRLPVVDGDRLVGILTSLDVVRLVAEGRLIAA